ncbi:Sperm-specific class P protein 9/11 [Parelaphostrongylus tenuis]|uniref:Sperm-specific class P protein 9/11 n=1 Tax=Parelaphostrongylus tenuis TaxID=148309 RepID=A0AAD5QYQ7_PARTN|nr:Sperm-specific class P protein 9/11 [Parelaphostrongylus tenuis]
MSLTIDPPAAAVPAAGGTSSHTLINAGEAKVIFKVKCSNNNDYRLKPVFGFVDAAGNAPLEITRTAGEPKEDKLVIQWGPAPPDATDAQAAFPSIPADQLQSLTVPISAT